MAQLLIRDIEQSVIQLLKLSAKQHHRSLQGELKSIVEAAVSNKMSMEEARKMCKIWHKRLAAGKFGDSTELLREDRSR